MDLAVGQKRPSVPYHVSLSIVQHGNWLHQNEKWKRGNEQEKASPLKFNCGSGSPCCISFTSGKSLEQTHTYGAKYIRMCVLIGMGH